MEKYKLGEITVFVYANGKFNFDNRENSPFENVRPENEHAEYAMHPNFEVNTDGDRMLFLGGNELSFDGASQEGNTLTLTYTHKAKGLLATVKLECEKNVIVQTNRLKNIGDSPVNLTRFSSSIIDKIAYSEDKPWYEHDLKVWICHNKWQGEAQWREFTPSQLGVYPSNNFHWTREAYRITSIGSWSTSNFYPLLIIKDGTDKKTWFMETEGSQSWQIKLTCHAGYFRPNLSLEATSADETLGGWYYYLKPGEEYEAARAFYGVVDGGFEEAAAALNAFKRRDSAVKVSCPPVVFNDYMNCVWLEQTPEVLIPLIKAAAAAGSECFCIDDGWHENKLGPGMGDWLPIEERYSKTSLKDIADIITENGMVPGIWLELDACNETAELFKTDEDSVIRRYGRPVGKGIRHFYNFKNKRVLEHLTERIKYLYDIGYRFIKNDYNQSTGIGCTNNYDGDSPAEGLIENSNAFYAFIDSLYEKFPGLIIENCGSGAMREDNKTLKRFAMQSTSDQVLYKNNPSIIMGASALIPPEKAGIWVYPYPSKFNASFEATKEYMDQRADGKETAFNIVNGMMGSFYLSGRIDCCDAKNFALLKRGIEIYKDIRKYIPQSRTVYPTGMHEINSKETASMGLLSRNRLMLAVWNTDEKNAEMTIDLTKYISGEYEVTRAFSHRDMQYRLNEGKLDVAIEGESALWLEIQNTKQ